MTANAQKRLFSAERKLKEKISTAVTEGALAVDHSGISNQELLTAINALRSAVIMKAAKQHHDDDHDSHDTGKSALHARYDNESDELRAKIDEVNLLRTEVRALSRSIHDTKREIKALGLNEEDKFSIVTNELDQIVGATERATETILSSAEKIDELAHQLKQHSPDQFVTQLTDEMLENTIAMFEACNFQDLCGQRTTKVVNTLKFIEDRVERMLEIWGEENFDTVDHPDEVLEGKRNKSPEGEELHGPAEHGGGISQADIDALFD